MYDTLIEAVSWASSFALIGGECDEFVRFLELEWHSFAQEYSDQQLRRFNLELQNYATYRKNPERNWRETFSNRDFTKLVI